MVTELTLEILDGENPPIWTKRIELQPYVRARGIEKYPGSFDPNRPRPEVFRDGINTALKQRPDIMRDHTL